MPASDRDLIDLFEKLAIEAGAATMPFYTGECVVATKADASPVTVADQAAEEIILKSLRAALPEIPCVAEEEVASGHLPPSLGDAFFLVDPLDGTKEFINRRPDFTVNIALVRNGAPSVGVVFAPASGKLYSGRPGLAEELIIKDGAIEDRRLISTVSPRTPPVIVASRSHSTPETDAFVANYPDAKLVSVGSSLKFCLLACGEADLYPRFGRTMEWDTAAGDAVLRAAGGITTMTDGAPFVYGKRNQSHDSDFANPHFVARGRA